MSTSHNNNSRVLLSPLLLPFFLAAYMITFLRELLSLEYRNNVTYIDNIVLTKHGENEVDSTKKTTGALHLGNHNYKISSYTL
jgi:hypothetical protein